MNKTNTILVPVDFTECSINALEKALPIAQTNGSAIIVLHVMDSMHTKTESLDENDSLNPSEKNCFHKLNQIKASIQSAYGFDIEVMVKKGAIAESVVQTALENNSILIVTGTHGTGSKTSFLGSQAYSIIQQATCPVLTIPRLKKHSIFTKILFPDLFMTDEKYEFLKAVVQKKDVVIEISDLPKNNLVSDSTKLNSQILFLENKLIEANIQSSQELQQTLLRLNEIYPLKIKLLIAQEELIAPR